MHSLSSVIVTLRERLPTPWNGEEAASLHWKPGPFGCPPGPFSRSDSAAHPQQDEKYIGILLIVLGLLGFVEIERQEERSIPIGPVVSGVVVLAGITLLVFGVREEGSTVP